MTRLAAFILRLCFGSGVLCLLALLVGWVSAAGEPAIGLANCGGTPCVYGIAPGHVGWGEAQQGLLQRARQFSQFISQPKSITAVNAKRGTAALYISVDLTNVGRISLTPEGEITAGWLLAHFGQPCGITIYRYNNIITLRYPTLLANVDAATHRITASTPLQHIQVLDPAFKSDYQRNVCIDNVTDGARNYRWAGFARARYYAAHPGLWQR